MSSEPRRQSALITGASRGIGAAIARVLGTSYNLLLGGRDRDTLEDLAASLPSATPWPVELTDFDAIVMEAAAIDRLDVLIHSAGIWVPGPISETLPETWRDVFDVNVFAVAELTRVLLPAVRIARGHIVLINSTAGLQVSPARGTYAASKFALKAFAKALRAEEAKNGVGVTSIYLGRVATEMQREVRRSERGPFDESEYIAPESVAKVVLSVLEAPSDCEVTEVTVAKAYP
jgi:NADP-dependent 3-hydroxy acid dehydrogenase YdfG